MTLLIIGLCLFIGVHVVPSSPGLRGALAARLGEGSYKIAFSLVSIAGLILTGLGFHYAPATQVFEPSRTARDLLPGAMAVAFALVAVSQAPGYLRRIIRHPMLTGVLIWSAMHLLANGDLASNILFGAFALWSTFAIISALRRDKRPKAPKASFVADILAVIAGLLVYGAILRFHETLFGVPAI